MAVERSLRIGAPCICDAAEVLRAAGLWAEAAALDSSGLIDWATDAIASGRVITSVSEHYPRQWIDVFGASAPPALWRSGPIPTGPLLAIVGSSDVTRSVSQFAQAAGEEAVRMGYAVVSGDARGCDRSAIRGAGGERSLVILPFGFDVHSRLSESSCALTVCAPNEEFSTGSAMERNALIYAMAEAAVIVHARFKTGGTWHGAVEAHRRKLTRLILREDPRNKAHRALLGLGAIGIGKPEQLSEALASNPMQPTLPRSLRLGLDGDRRRGHL